MKFIKVKLPEKLEELPEEVYTSIMKTSSEHRKSGVQGMFSVNHDGINYSVKLIERDTGNWEVSISAQIEFPVTSFKFPI